MILKRSATSRGACGSAASTVAPRSVAVRACQPSSTGSQQQEQELHNSRREMLRAALALTAAPVVAGLVATPAAEAISGSPLEYKKVRACLTVSSPANTSGFAETYPSVSDILLQLEQQCLLSSSDYLPCSAPCIRTVACCMYIKTFQVYQLAQPAQRHALTLLFGRSLRVAGARFPRASTRTGPRASSKQHRAV